MKKIELIIRPEKLEPLKKILSKNEYSGLTVMSAMGCGHQKGYSEEFKKLGMEINLLPKLYVMTVILDEDLGTYSQRYVRNSPPVRLEMERYL